MNIKKYVFQRAAVNHIPVSGTFELTPRCNLSCEMCYIRMSAAEEAAMGQELTADEWLSLGRQAVDAGMVYLLLTGGEPLLRPDFAEIYSGLAKMGIMLTLNTNGTLINEYIVQCMEHNPPEKVNVTLYGASGDTYQKVCGNANGYKAALQGIGLLKEAKIPVCINTTYTRHNASDMEYIVSFAKENGIPVRMTSYLFPPLRCRRETDASCFLHLMNTEGSERHLIALRWTPLRKSGVLISLHVYRNIHLHYNLKEGLLPVWRAVVHSGLHGMGSFCHAGCFRT